MNIVESSSVISEKIKDCIRSEMNPNGLLSDVKTFIPSYRMNEKMKEPCIWLFEHPTIPVDGKKAPLSKSLYLATPFEFVCVVYDKDIETAEMKGKNLASRVAACIQKHALKLHDGERVIDNIVFKTFYPAGEVQIENKSEKTPATSIVFEARFWIDWLKCCRTQQNQQNNDNNEEE